MLNSVAKIAHATVHKAGKINCIPVRGVRGNASPHHIERIAVTLSIKEFAKFGVYEFVHGPNENKVSHRANYEGRS